ncbi:TetR/AcrR family transcriptional regulator [Streptomyces sp. DT24]|uniref:TetR/AcrR family transcriptional regulator n=1 Tax=unclassified Streptomyces TaxID=2593676 RepID=UPI0023BA1004|nr:TetR/AcrR family transcriptional regulator [Streptomyces sp. AM 4-1-1]WEH37502.1 TetR/AcrR family transcriptional regulator [Streptomyces sp. AM 4-1-1]
MAKQRAVSDEEFRENARSDEYRLRCRERLLAAGCELFSSRGYVHTALEDLCAEAGVSEREFHQEFTSQEALLIALHDEVTSCGLRAAESALLAEGMDQCSTRERVALLFDAYVLAVTRDPRAARVAFVEVLGVSHRVDEHLLMWRNRWVEFLTAEAERAVSRGEAADREHGVTVVVTIGSCNELMAHHSRRPRQVTPAEVSAELTRLSLAMLGAP